MTPDEPAMDDATLHAYVDGQLTAEDAAQVAAWLQQHPADAERVLAWQAQRSQLQALRLDLLEETLPPRFQSAWGVMPAGPGGPKRRWLTAVGWAANGPWAAAAMLLLGLGLGWSLRPLLTADPGTGAISSAAVPGFVRDAALAHALYAPERRHAVEVGAEQEEHLVQWLSKRLGTPLRVPALSAQGFHLVGGRLLPGSVDVPDAAGAGARAASGPGTGPGPGNVAGIARAQFMYQNAQGERLTLYVSVLPPSSGAATDTPDTAFRFATTGHGADARQSFYWLDGRLGYALTGQLDRQRLAMLAEAVYRGLTPQ
jgi:anti-sigma factor RsiW